MADDYQKQLGAAIEALDRVLYSRRFDHELIRPICDVLRAYRNKGAFDWWEAEMKEARNAR